MREGKENRRDGIQSRPFFVEPRVEASNLECKHPAGLAEIASYAMLDMIFEKVEEQKYDCITWNCDCKTEEDVKCGELRIGPEPYFYFFPEGGIPLSCGDVRFVMRKLRELNKLLHD